jgi:hypothetical protein
MKGPFLKGFSHISKRVSELVAISKEKESRPDKRAVTTFCFHQMEQV